MLRTALRNVLAHKARLLMTVLAVLLGVAFVSGTLVFTSTISQAFQASSEEGRAHVDVAIRPTAPSHSPGPRGPGTDAGRTSVLDERILERARALPGAAQAAGSVSGFAGLADKQGSLVGEGFSSEGANYSPGAEDHRLRDGRAPRRDGEIALDARTAARTGYGVGDTVRLSVDGPVRSEKVVGVFTTQAGNVTAGGTLVLYDTATAQQLFGKPGQYDEITLRAAPGASQADLQRAVEKLLPKGTEAVTGKKLAEDESKAIEQQMSGMQTGMLVFAGIALFVGVFLIANTFTMLVSQRTRELALLRAVGASRRQVTRSVLAEAVMVGTVAAVAGLAAGIGIAAGMRELLGTFEVTVPDGPLVVSSEAVLTALATGIFVTVLAAWLPARRAAKIPPVAAMSSVHATATTRSLVLRNTLGLLIAAAGTALVLHGSTRDDVDAGKGPMGLGAALLLVGVFVLTPLLSRPLIAAAGPLLRVFGVAGKLARQNAVRNPRRTAATASALMVGLTLITGMTVVAGSVQQAVDRMATKSVTADYTVGFAGYPPLSPEVGRKLAKSGEVTSLSPLRVSSARVAGGPSQLTGVNGRSLAGLTDVPLTSGSWTGLRGNGVVVDEATAKEHGWRTGSSFPVTYADGKQSRLVVKGVCEGNELLTGVLIDTATLDPHLSQAGDTQVLVETRDGASEETKAALEKATGHNPAILIQDKQDRSASVAQIFHVMLNMLYGLLAMAVLVAVLGVVNTLAMSVFERTQEIGMLRAVGLDRRGVRRMVRLESLVISVFGGVMGIGLGVFFGWAAGELIGPSLSTYELVLPWARMGLCLAMAAVVGLLAALWPARRAARLDMLEAIKAE